MSSTQAKQAELRRQALEYHEFPTPGKVAIAATKQLVNQRDLALAYSPGVAAAFSRASRLRLGGRSTRAPMLPLVSR